MKLPKSIRDVAIYVLANFAGAFLGYVSLPFFTSHLTPEEFGIWGYVLTANTFLSPVILLDLHSYYLVAYYQNEENKSALLNSLISFSFLWTLLFLLFSFLVGGIIFRSAGISVGFHPFMSTMLLSNLTSTFFLFLVLQYRLEGKSEKYAALTILQVALGLAFSIILMLSQRADIFWRITGFSLSAIILGVLSWITLVRKYHFKFTLNRSILKDGVRFSLPLIPYSIAIVLFDFLDRFFLERSMTLAQTGFYSLAFQFTSLLSIFFLAVLRVFEPNIMKWMVDKEYKRFIHFFYLYLSGLFLTCVIFTVAAPIILAFVTNPKYVKAGPIAVQLVTAFYFKTVFLLLMTLLISFAKTNFQMILSLSAVTLFGISGYWVTSAYQMQGMILLKTGIYIAMCLLSFGYGLKYMPLKGPMALSLAFGFILLFYCNFYN